MAELAKIRMLICVSLIIFPAHALDVIFSGANDDMKQKSEINTRIENGEKTYGGTLNELTYQPKPDTSKVIVYIIDRSRFVEIIRNAVRGTVSEIAEELKEWHCELVFLGIDNFEDNEYHLISAFIADQIQRHPGQMNFTTETMGENRFDRAYYHTIADYVLLVEQYHENVQICGGTLKKRLRSIPRGALRPVGRNGKEIKLLGLHPTMGEVRWPVSVKNGTYSPEVDVSDPKNNFRMRYKTKKLCLLILSGREYVALVSYGKRLALKLEMSKVLTDMTENNEALLIFGAFNFDWTEIYIVTQIILEHSVVSKAYLYNVFTYGHGMFNTQYQNVYVKDGRKILPQPKSNLAELIKVLMGQEMKERAIKMYYSSYGWKDLKIPIELENGRYLPAESYKNYTFPWVNQKIAFIVHDATEKNAPIDIRMVYQSMEELKQSGIYVVGIEAVNFGLHDMHIIAQWIDYHRGVHVQNADREVIDSEQIAVLGGGVFKTMFQSESTTYNTLFDIKKNELKKIRNAFVKSAKTKRVFVGRIVNPKFEVWTFPMDTVNGYYEPDLIPDMNIFETGNEAKIFFIITSADRFHQIARMENVGIVTSSFRKEIRKHFTYVGWNVFLVGLDNFEERDNHLFAELVKRQTRDERPLYELVLTFNYDIGHAAFHYKDTPPFPVVNNSKLESRILTFFEKASCR